MLIALVITACGSEPAENSRQRDRAQEGVQPKSCAPAEAKLSSAFRPLPPGFSYERLPDEKVDALLAKGFRAIAGRRVLERGRFAGVVVAQVSSTPIEDEAEHLRGAVAGLQSDGPALSVTLNGRDVKRVTAPSGTWYLSIYGGCTVVAVQSADADDALRIARAVHR